MQMRDLSLWFPKQKVLVIADLHIGKEEELNKDGLLVPRTATRTMRARFMRILKGISPKTIVIAGDLKHEFGTISETEWRDVLGFLDLCLQRCGEVVLIKGNHDTVLGPIADKRKVTIKPHFAAGDVLIIHGDAEPPPALLKGVKTVVAGHKHPAITLKEGARAETYKCFLKGPYKGRELMILPSFSPLAEGSNILVKNRVRPLVDDASDFRVYAVSDRTYDFGTVGRLQRNV